jgi:hypothetical protein
MPRHLGLGFTVAGFAVLRHYFFFPFFFFAAASFAFNLLIREV